MPVKELAVVFDPPQVAVGGAAAGRGARAGAGSDPSRPGSRCACRLAVVEAELAEARQVAGGDVEA